MFLVIPLGVTARPLITSQDQLPRFEYPAPSPVTLVLTDEEAFASLAAAVRRDVEALLRDYEIADRTTRQGLIGTLMSLDLAQGEDASALARIAEMRELEEKPANRLTMGLLAESLIESRAIDHANEAARRAHFAEMYAAKINALPFAVVQDNIRSSKASAEIFTEALLLGSVAAQVQPGVDRTGMLSGDLARSLLSQAVSLRQFLPLKEERVAVLDAFLSAHALVKPDIWAARDVDLDASAELTPVVIAVWDSGVDTAIFAGLLWTNEAEVADGTDTDGNGFVDDRHGIAFDRLANREPHLLYPLSEEQLAAYPQKRDFTKGLLDLQAAIDSPEASALRTHLGGLAPDDVPGFLEGLNLFGNYTHGTHVAGIAVAGNPAARLLTVRITFDHRLIPDVPTREQALKDAAAAPDTVAYLQTQGARVVNMSWGGSPRGLEAAFEANGEGGTPEERRQLSRELFEIMRDALTEAMRAAPEILFVVAAGNSDNDATFDEMIPSGIDLPNILTVGAVDQAGEETSFSSFGPRVAVHANGFEVDSYLPGGERMKYSGTSMAAPNVANLAGKLLAVAPWLDAGQVSGLITLGADRDPSGRLRLINPQRSFALLRVMMEE
jgi:subtilisin family serine protease